MLKSNPTARNSSEQEYETASLIGLQSLVTLEMPILDQWAEWWTSSQLASLVSPIPRLDCVEENRTNETSGLIHSELSEKPSQGTPYSKTSQGYYPPQEIATWNQQAQRWETLQLGLLGMRQQLSGSLPKSGMTANGILYPPKMQERHTLEKDGGVLPTKWPTPRVSGQEGYDTRAARKGHDTAMSYLESAVEYHEKQVKWPTPTATDSSVGHARTPENMVRKDGRNVLRTPNLAETILQENDFPYTKQDLAMKEKGEDYTVAKRLWPTPSSMPRGPHTGRDYDGLQTVSKTTGTKFGMTLETAIKHYPTPTASDHNGWSPGHKRADIPNNRLDFMVESEAHNKNWPTPRAGNPGSRAPGTGGKVLNEEVKRWPTPTVMEAGKMSNRPNYGQMGLSNHPAIVGLPTRAKGKQSMKNDGTRPSENPRKRDSQNAVLSSKWVTWLMGLPLGWVALEPLPKEAYDEWFERTTNQAWWEEEQGLPRAAPSEVERTNKLKALGNGIVPATIAVLLNDRIRIYG